jgi:hypothetical protein
MVHAGVLCAVNCAADRLRREMEIMKNYNTICCRGCGREVGSSKDVFCMSLEVPPSTRRHPLFVPLAPMDLC